MKHLILLILLSVGIHGIRHNKSHVYVNMCLYESKKKARIQRLIDEMHVNGIGA